MSNETKRCPTCGTTTLSFDPPIEVELAEPCGQMKPGNYTASWLPICDLPEGHEGVHSWLPDLPPVTWP